MPSRSGPKKSKTAVKKTNRVGGLDSALTDLDLNANNNNKLPSLGATGIENALDALDVVLADSSVTKADRHAERRVKAAYTAFKERRLEEMNEDGSGKGLRLSQKLAQIKTEFKKSPENPLNNLHVKHNATKEEIEDLKQQERGQTEARLTSE